MARGTRAANHTQDTLVGDARERIEAEAKVKAEAEAAEKIKAAEEQIRADERAKIAAGQTTSAINHPAIKTAGVHTEDMPLAQPGDIIIPDSGPLTRQAEVIVPADATALNKDYADALAFNEQVLEILLEPSSEENAPTVVDVTVNGETVWIPVGQNIHIKRKHVEVLMRSKPVAVSTQHESHESGAKVINNRVIRNTRAKYPLSILHDPAQGKGIEWMRRIRAEL